MAEMNAALAKKAYKLVAIDLDDTLLRGDLSISEGNIRAIRQAIGQGVTVMIATGRMYASALPFAKQLELDVPLITYQGALVKTSVSGEVLYEKLLDAQTAFAAIRIGREHGVHMQAYSQDRLYAQEANEHADAYTRLSRVPYHVRDLMDVSAEGVPKLLYAGEPEFLDRFAPKVREALGNRANVFKSKPYFLEVTHPEATKGQALDYVVRRMGIARENVMAIGDSYNDIDMLEYAGLGIAMANAPEAIRRKADYVTGHHEQDGVAEALRRFVLNVES